VSVLSVGEEARGPDGTTVSVTDPEVEKTVLTPEAGPEPHASPTGSEGEQFLTVTVRSSTGDVGSVPLSLRLDGTDRGRGPYTHARSPGSVGRLSFAVPVATFDGGAVAWSHPGREYRWRLPGPVVGLLGASPRFEVRAFEADDRTPDDRFSCRIAVRNAGERDGMFRGVVHDRGASSVPYVRRVAIPVSRGETVERRVTGRAVSATGGTRTAVLDWGLGERSSAFEVSPGS
jgi:hypothetical protein